MSRSGAITDERLQGRVQGSVRVGGHLPSTLSWLDQTAEEQRRVREIVALFSQPESRDELGIGQIRDVFSDRLFPGVSVIQTRARYFLFVPWIFQLGEARGYSGPRLAAWAERQERTFIENLRQELVATGQPQDGLIGRVAGASIKILPSTIYWSGLHRWGILTDWVSQDELGLHRPDRKGAEELAERDIGDWHPTLPSPPEEFPDRPTGGFRLTSDESGWLRERLLISTHGSLLAHLIDARSRPVPDAVTPWDDPASATVAAPLKETLAHARRFSIAMHGAALLYNLLVGERYVEDELTAVDDPVGRYRQLLAGWSEELAALDLADWELDDFWALVRTDNPRISPWTERFVDAWIELVSRDGGSGIADAPDARGLVADRERRTKGRQSRLDNPKMRQTWSGESGAGQLNFRWGTVRALVTDIIDGLGSSDDAPA